MAFGVRVPVWVGAGLWAALLSGAPSFAIALARGDDVWTSTEAVGAVLVTDRRGRWLRMGAGALAHLGISLFWARVLTPILRARAGAGPALATGAACGGGIALLDLGIVGRLLPPIRKLDGLPLLADHLAFGAVVGWIVFRRHEDRPATAQSSSGAARAVRP